MKINQMVAAAVFLWLLAIAGISNANAAQLSVLTGYQSSLFTVNKCDAAVAATPTGRVGQGQSPNYTEVAISGIDAACNGLPLTYVLFDSNGNMVKTGSGTASTGTVTFATNGNYNVNNVASAAVLIGTWPIPTTWN